MCGIFIAVVPKIVWNIKYSLDVNGGEPTGFYIIITRCAGILVTLLSKPYFIGLFL